MVKHSRVRGERDRGLLRVVTSRWKVLLPFACLIRLLSPFRKTRTVKKGSGASEEGLERGQGKSDGWEWKEVEESRLLRPLKEGMKREQWRMVRSGGKGCTAGDR